MSDSPHTATAAGLDLRAAIRLRDQLLRIVCSSRWQDDLYALFLHHQLPSPLGLRQKKLEHVLSRAEVYPPGGHRTKMIRCQTCNRWTPPQAVGSVGTCYDCYVAGIPDAQAAQLPSSHRYTWIVSSKEAKAYLTGEVVRERRSNRAQFRDDDPRVVGGPIVGEERVMLDPWLGEIWPNETPDLSTTAAHDGEAA